MSFMVDPTLVLGTEKFFATRRKIKDATLGLIGAGDLSGISMSDVARAAGVSRGTIYNYFQTPQEVFESLAADFVQAMSVAVDKANLGQPDPAARVVNGLRRHFDWASEHPRWGRVLPRFFMSEEALQVGLRAHMLADLRAGLASGRFVLATEDLEAVLAVVGGSVISTVASLADQIMARPGADEVIVLLMTLLGVPRAEILDMVASPLPPIDLSLVPFTHGLAGSTAV